MIQPQSSTIYGNNMKTDTKKITRQALRDRDGHLCHYCAKPNAHTIDHVVPQSQGGSDDLDNLVLACTECNHKKGSMAYENFIKMTKPLDKPKSLWDRIFKTNLSAENKQLRLDLAEYIKRNNQLEAELKGAKQARDNAQAKLKTIKSVISKP